MNEQQWEALRSIGRELSPADLSVLQAGLDSLNPDQPTLLTTSPGSNNDKVWSQMVAAGWMSAGSPLDVPVPSKVYIINPAAKDEIREFIEDNQHSTKMTAILNDLRAKIPPMLLQTVHGANGTPADLAIMLGCVVEATMRRGLKPELHDEFLREVARIAQAMRSV